MNRTEREATENLHNNKQSSDKNLKYMKVVRMKIRRVDKIVIIHVWKDDNAISFIVHTRGRLGLGKWKS